jgi:hypothetical protein
MEWQRVASLAIVALAAALLLWSKFRRRKYDMRRDTHCGCAGAASPRNQSSIIWRARKGARPEVIIKMK